MDGVVYQKKPYPQYHKRKIAFFPTFQVGMTNLSGELHE
jgi:hypothetical protein